MKQDKSIVAYNIKFLRKREDLAQWEMGKKYGGNQKQISAWENGVNKPDTGFLLKLSKGSGIDADIIRTVKLKTDVEGNIINIPKKEQELQEIRKEFYKRMNAYRANTESFFKSLQLIISRLDQIEKKLKK